MTWINVEIHSEKQDKKNNVVLPDLSSGVVL